MLAGATTAKDNASGPDGNQADNDSDPQVEHDSGNKILQSVHGDDSQGELVKQDKTVHRNLLRKQCNFQNLPVKTSQKTKGNLPGCEDPQPES